MELTVQELLAFGEGYNKDFDAGNKYTEGYDAGMRTALEEVAGGSKEHWTPQQNLAYACGFAAALLEITGEKGITVEEIKRRWNAVESVADIIDPDNLDCYNKGFLEGKEEAFEELGLGEMMLPEAKAYVARVEELDHQYDKGYEKGIKDGIAAGETDAAKVVQGQFEEGRWAGIKATFEAMGMPEVTSFPEMKRNLLSQTTEVAKLAREAAIIEVCQALKLGQVKDIEIAQCEFVDRLSAHYNRGEETGIEKGIRIALNELGWEGLTIQQAKEERAKVEVAHTDLGNLMPSNPMLEAIAREALPLCRLMPSTQSSRWYNRPQAIKEIAYAIEAVWAYDMQQQEADNAPG